MVKDHINQYNYTLNPLGIFNSIKFMYTYYPDPNNKTHIREEFVRVSQTWSSHLSSVMLIFSVLDGFLLHGPAGRHREAAGQ